MKNEKKANCIPGEILISSQKQPYGFDSFIPALLNTCPSSVSTQNEFLTEVTHTISFVVGASMGWNMHNRYVLIFSIFTNLLNENVTDENILDLVVYWGAEKVGKTWIVTIFSSVKSKETHYKLTRKTSVNFLYKNMSLFEFTHHKTLVSSLYPQAIINFHLVLKYFPVPKGIQRWPEMTIK